MDMSIDNDNNNLSNIKKDDHFDNDNEEKTKDCLNENKNLEQEFLEISKKSSEENQTEFNKIEDMSKENKSNDVVPVEIDTIKSEISKKSSEENQTEFNKIEDMSKENNQNTHSLNNS